MQENANFRMKKYYFLFFLKPILLCLGGDFQCKTDMSFYINLYRVLA